jgi:hypothetical protein
MEGAMTAQANQTSARTTAEASTAAGAGASAQSNLYQEGVIAGILAAATIAVFFFIVDTVQGRPFYTPSVLGTALFRGGRGLESSATLPISGGMVLMFTWVHALVFAAIGGIVAWLLDAVERKPDVGFGVVILFTVAFAVFEFGLVAAAAVFAPPVFRALSWPAILLANLLAAVVMAVYFRLRHPQLRIWP